MNTEKIAERAPITPSQRLAQALAIIVAGPADALLKAEKVFEAYAYIHATKTPPTAESTDKARVNHELAQEMRQAHIAITELEPI